MTRLARTVKRLASKVTRLARIVTKLINKGTRVAREVKRLARMVKRLTWSLARKVAPLAVISFLQDSKSSLSSRECSFWVMNRVKRSEADFTAMQEQSTPRNCSEADLGEDGRHWWEQVV